MSGAPVGAPSDPIASSGPRSDRPSKKPQLRGDIEGLRAIAVGTVLLFHMGIPWVSGGYAGVDIFFVISGFLITSLLLREASRSGTVSIADFYARRARRLLPAATVVLLFTAAAGYLLLPPTSRGDLSTDVAAATLYVVNWALALRSVDYLAEDSGLSPLQHYWSLSVEEQFYVFWPLIILAGLLVARRLRVRPLRMLFVVLAVVAAASLAYSVLHTERDPASAYFATTTRVWELAIGALTAFAVDRLRRTLSTRLAAVMAWVGLALIAVASLAFTKQTPWPGSAALVPTIGTALVIAAGCAGQTTLPARLLSLRPLTWLGGISYSVYLWHWPLIVIASERYPDLQIRYKVLLGLISIAAAWLTKRLVEDPIRFNKGLAARPSRALLMGAALMACSLLAALGLSRTVPALGTTADVPGATALVADASAEEWVVRDDPSAAYTTSGAVTPNPAVATDDVPSYYDDDCQVQDGVIDVDLTCTYGKADSDKVMALVGDSKTGQWFPTFEAIAEREGWRLDVYLKSKCPFAADGDGVWAECATYTDEVLAAMEDPQRTPDLVVSSTGADVKQSASLAAPLRTLASKGAQVVVLADNVKPERPVYECVAAADEGSFASCSFPYQDVDTTLRRAAAAVDGTYLAVDEWICPKGATCPAAVGSALIYRQGSHITATYARTMTPIVWRELSAAGITTTPVADIGVGDIPEATGSARG